MATLSGGSGSANAAYSHANPGTYRDVFGFDNAPDSTNLPQIYEREVTIYGNRTLMGFLRMIGSESATNSQQIRWVEQRRLHVYSDNAIGSGANTFYVGRNGGAAVTSAPANVFVNHAFRENDKVLISNKTGLGTATVAGTELFIITGVNATSGEITVEPYGASTNTIATDDELNVLVIGTEYGKGSNPTRRTLQAEFDNYTNSTTIMREQFSVNGTDSNQIGWVEIQDENGGQGKYWYVKGKSETMTRWNDYLELSLLEDKFKVGGTAVGKGSADNELGYTEKSGATPASQGGSQGFFDAIEERGNKAAGGFNTGSDTFLQDLDNIIEVLDKEGNIEENLFYLNRAQSLNFDDGMSTQNNGTGGTSSSWGIFNNSESMGLSLGFNSVRRGSYDFYKKDWKYLNQLDGRSNFEGVQGVSIPMGTKSVYDQMGSNLSSPFASIHYLAGPTQNRKNVSWAHGGSFGGGYDSRDSMTLEFLTERCICLKGANNFILFE